jgi:hypothetical protein
MAQTKFKVEDGLLVRGQANITGNTVISGTLTLEANVVTGITANGNIVPTSNNTYTLGTSGSRWLRLFANSGNFANTLEVTGQANLYGGAHLRGSLSFDTNNHISGNTTAMPSVTHTSNVIVYDTLSVGASGNSHLISNSSVTRITSNLTLTASQLALKNGATTFTSANTDPAGIVISTNIGAPTTLFEYSNTVKLAKFLVFARDNSSNNVQSSEITILYNGTNASARIGEFNVMFSGNTPFMSYGVALVQGQPLVRLTGFSTSSNVYITLQATTLI